MSQKTLTVLLATLAMTTLLSACSFGKSAPVAPELDANGKPIPTAEDKEKSDKEIKKTVGEVSKIMDLPTGESPTIFEITDPETLSAQQPFFNGSVKGDKLLIYPASAKAIIYSPSREKIINVGPLTFDNTPKTAPEAPTPKK